MGKPESCQSSGQQLDPEIALFAGNGAGVAVTVDGIKVSVIDPSLHRTRAGHAIVHQPVQLADIFGIRIGTVQIQHQLAIDGINTLRCAQRAFQFLRRQDA